MGGAYYWQSFDSGEGGGGGGVLGGSGMEGYCLSLAHPADKGSFF